MGQELGLDVKVVKMDFLSDKSECLRSPDFLKVNPSGKYVTSYHYLPSPPT